MVFKRPNSKNYWFEFSWRGQRIQESAKTTNKRAAEQIEAARRLQLAKGEVGIVERQVVPTLKNFLTARFLPWVQVECKSKPKTVSFYEQRVASLVKSRLANKPLDLITEEDITDFKKLSRNSLATTNRDLATLRKAGLWAVSIKLIQSFVKVRLTPGEKSRDFVLDYDQEEKYLSVVEEPLKTVALIMLDCGLRPEEVHRLKHEQIKDGKVVVFFGKGGASRRTIELTSRINTALSKLGKDDDYVFPAPTKTGHINEDSLKKKHAKAIRLSALPKFVVYSLRHTCITRWAQAGIDVAALKYLAGHRSISTTMKYVHLAALDIQERLRKARENVGKNVGSRRHTGKDKSEQSIFGTQQRRMKAN